MVGASGQDAYSRALSFMKRRRFGQAAALFRDLAFAHGRARDLAGLASALVELGNYDDAIVTLDDAISRKPNYASIYAIRGRLRACVDQYEEALSDLINSARLRRRLRSAHAAGVPAHLLLLNLEQLEHIQATGFGKRLRASRISPGDRATLRNQLVTSLSDPSQGIPSVNLKGPGSSTLLNPPYVWHDSGHLIQCLNPRLDWTSLDAAFKRAKPKVLVVDDFLNPEALAALREFCLGSTVWRRPYPYGYVGAFPEDGFACEAIFQLVRDLKFAFPTALRKLRLCHWWAFVYDSQLRGIDVHGDDAEVTVNLWITPDSANLDSKSGGLIIWDKPAPRNWSFNRINSDGSTIRKYLADSGARPTTVLYKENRAVIFEGRLFHQTDRMQFSSGYVCRRRNITLLFKPHGPNYRFAERPPQLVKAGARD